MNTKALLITCLMVIPTINANKDVHHMTTIPLNKMQLHVDENDVRLEMQKSSQMDPRVKIAYIVSGGVVATAAITAAVILTVHFNQ